METELETAQREHDKTKKQYERAIDRAAILNYKLHGARMRLLDLQDVKPPPERPPQEIKWPPDPKVGGWDQWRTWST
ncbi:MAG: hypothetical protein ABL951_02595 [Alphaproteobacteria bacterium]